MAIVDIKHIASHNHWREQNPNACMQLGYQEAVPMMLLVKSVACLQSAR